jgi:uncharacterized protein YecE (DUF72 family)
LINWYNNSPDNFRFTLKAPKIITHVKQLNGIRKLIESFYELTKLLKEKLSCHLFQLPPHFNLNEKNLKILEKFLNELDDNNLNVVEFRHQSWWKNQIYELLKSYKVIFCIVSGLGMPDNIIETNDIVYFRFHGTYYSGSYSDDNLSNYVTEMKKSDCKEIYAYFNNDQKAYATKNARKLKEILKIPNNRESQYSKDVLSNYF